MCCNIRNFKILYKDSTVISIRKMNSAVKSNIAKKKSSSAVNIVQPLVKSSKIDKLPQLKQNASISMQQVQLNDSSANAQKMVERFNHSEEDQTGGQRKLSMAKSTHSSDMTLPSRRPTQINPSNQIDSQRNLDQIISHLKVPNVEEPSQ